MAESPWMVRAHGVSEAPVHTGPHGVPMASVHGVLCERLKSSRSMVISKFETKFDGWMNGEDGRGVDLLAKHQIHGSNQPNLTRSTNCKKTFLGYFWWGFSD